MQLTSGILAAAVLGLGSLSIYLDSELDAERERANTEAQHWRDLQAQVANLESADLPIATSNSDPGDLQAGLPWPPVEGAEALTNGDIQAEATSKARDDHMVPAARNDFNRRRLDAALRHIYRGVGQN